MSKKAILTASAPRPIGPYSQAVQVGNLLFVSGQVPLDPASGEIVGAEVSEQTRRTLENLLAILREAGLGLEQVVKTTVYLKDLADFAAMNEVYAGYFKHEVAPARAPDPGAPRPKDVRVEIDAIAVG
jgi:2-iminobutanoate/2-iminopropanoate deaminase